MCESIKSHLIISRDHLASNIIFVTGIRKCVIRPLLVEAVEDLSGGCGLERCTIEGGRAWLQFPSVESCIALMNNLVEYQLQWFSTRQGRYERVNELLRIQARPLFLRYEFGDNRKGVVRAPFPIRICEAAEHPHQDTLDTPSVTYNNQSLSVHHNRREWKYPIPTGVYLIELTKMSFMCFAKYQIDINSLFFDSPSKNLPKELSETMGSYLATQRALDIIYGVSEEVLINAIYILGDGKLSLCGRLFQLAMLLNKFPTCELWSIDPLTDLQSTHLFEDTEINEEIKLNRVVSRSQEFIIPPSSLQGLNVVVSCHSHAPLDEFWERMAGNSICVSLPCCSDYGMVKTGKIVIEYQDYEILSPKRHVIVTKK
eukprot:GHVH01017368.1.p1 GENE.GHVH01017368.1~~GHVH01017368.1.p1  ORF type:complete len:371 (-),score=45.49 GHVH01017368.1:25-1137(-)